MVAEDATRRFSRRVNDYVKYRPSYPDELVLVLRQRLGYHRGFVIADVGSGTGISSRFFLERGNRVFAVEPNWDMRCAAEQWLGSYSQFHSVTGRAEATTLPPASVDLVVAAQSFHWFDVDAAKQEFGRILRPGGHVAVLWNERRTDTTPFLRGYEALLEKYSIDYSQVSLRYSLSEKHMEEFFGTEPWGREEFPNRQSFDLEGLLGRALSSSYVPLEGHPNHAPLMTELEQLFQREAVDQKVVFEYVTRLFWGRVA